MNEISANYGIGPFCIMQYSMLATPYKFVTIIIYLVMLIVEVARLYLGYEGNLREKVYTITLLTHYPPVISNSQIKIIIIGLVLIGWFRKVRPNCESNNYYYMYCED